MGRIYIRQLAGKRRTLDLRGRSGCLSPVNIGIEMRGEMKWAPLADEGVPFSTGGVPDPITFRFRWFDRQFFGTNAPLLDGKAQTDVQLLLDALYDFCADGQIVELLHEHRTMFGIIRDIDGEMTRRGFMRVTMTFEPQRVRPKRKARPSPEPENALSFVRKTWGAMLSAASLPATLTSTVTDELASGIGQVNRAFQQLDGVVANYRNARRDLTALGQSFAQACASLEQASRDLGDVIDGDPNAFVQSDVMQLWFDFADMNSRVNQANRRIRQRLVQERENQRLGSDEQIQTVHYAAAGTNLRTLAALYWGSERAHLWRQIAEFNQLEGSLLAEGQSIVIPYPRAAA